MATWRTGKLPRLDSAILSQRGCHAPWQFAVCHNPNAGGLGAWGGENRHEVAARAKGGFDEDKALARTEATRARGNRDRRLLWTGDLRERRSSYDEHRSQSVDPQDSHRRGVGAKAVRRVRFLGHRRRTSHASIFPRCFSRLIVAIAKPAISPEPSCCRRSQGPYGSPCSPTWIRTPETRWLTRVSARSRRLHVVSRRHGGRGPRLHTNYERRTRGVCRLPRGRPVVFGIPEPRTHPVIAWPRRQKVAVPRTRARNDGGADRLAHPGAATSRVCHFCVPRLLFAATWAVSGQALDLSGSMLPTGQVRQGSGPRAPKPR